MSLATLKKKTQAKYNNISVGTGFSLNGFRRSQGYIGQTSLSRTNIYTPLKGNTPKGHGGCCGTYNNNIIKPAKCLEDYQTIRKSVLSSKGMLRLRNKWLQRGGEYAPVKPDSNHHNNISSMLTESKRRETLNEVSTEECKPLVGTIKCSKECGVTQNEIIQSKDDYTPLDHSEYLLRLKAKCVSNDLLQLESINNKQPFAGFN